MMCSITRPAKAQRLAVRRSPFAVRRSPVQVFV